MTSKVSSNCFTNSRELEQRHLLERVEQLVGAELRHDGVLSTSGWPDEPAVRWCAAPPARRELLRCVASAGSARASRSPQRRRPRLRSPRRRRPRSASAAGRPRRASAAAAAARRQPRRASAGFFSSSALARRAICDSGAWNSPAARVGSALRAPASLASSTSRDSRSAILADLGGGQRLAVEHAALDDQQRVGLGEVAQALGRLDRVALDERDRGRAGEQRRRRWRRRRRRPPAWSACS